MSDKGHWAVIDIDGIEVGRWATQEEADADAAGLNGPLGPGIDAEYDYTWVSE